MDPKLDIRLDNEPLFLGLKVPEKEKRLENIIGYDYEGFTSSFFIRQQELQIFSTLTSSERHERLVKLFKLKIFQNVYKKLKSTINELQREHYIVTKEKEFYCASNPFSRLYFKLFDDQDSTLEESFEKLKKFK